jgi:hypothetical protein
VLQWLNHFYYNDSAIFATATQSLFRFHRPFLRFRRVLEWLNHFYYNDPAIFSTVTQSLFRFHRPFFRFHYDTVTRPFFTTVTQPFCYSARSFLKFCWSFLRFLSTRYSDSVIFYSSSDILEILSVIFLIRSVISQPFFMFFDSFLKFC